MFNRQERGFSPPIFALIRRAKATPYNSIKERARNKFGTPLRWRRIYVRIQGVDTAHSWLRNYFYIAEDEHKDKRVVEVCRARSRF